ncbi:MAG TPA: hypothetical protein VMD53_15160 [Rhizomicrobium sp.]|nr:hypothetical protein [Rhizomicrobium sp.]
MLLALTSRAVAAGHAPAEKGLYVVLEVDLDSYWATYSQTLGDKVGAALKARQIDNTVQVTPRLVSICLPNAADHDAAQALVIATLKPEAKHGNFYLIPFGSSCFEISLGRAERQSVGTGDLALVFRNERRLLEQNGIDSSTLEFLPDGRIGIALQGYADKKDVQKLFVPELKIVETRPLGAKPH